MSAQRPRPIEQLLPLVLDETTTTLNTDLTPPINVNTASQTVLATLPGLEDSDIQNILSMRPDPTTATQAPDPIFQTPAWLLTQGNLSQATVKAIAPYITARSPGLSLPGAGLLRGRRAGGAGRGGGGRQQRSAAHRLSTRFGRNWDRHLI